MRARLALLAALPVVLTVAGCSSSKPGQKVVSPVPGNTLINVQPAKLPAKYANGDAAAGKPLFKSKGCSACHTLADAGATGTVGPNLDDAKPADTLILDRLLHGAGQMPSFRASLSPKQIGDVIAYVVQATSG